MACTFHVNEHLLGVGCVCVEGLGPLHGDIQSWQGLCRVDSVGSLGVLEGMKVHGMLVVVVKEFL